MRAPQCKACSRLAYLDVEVYPADDIKSWDPAVSRGCLYVGHKTCRYILKFARVHKCVWIVVGLKMGVNTVAKIHLFGRRCKRDKWKFDWVEFLCFFFGEKTNKQITFLMLLFLSPCFMYDSWTKYWERTIFLLRNFSDGFLEHFKY